MMRSSCASMLLLGLLVFHGQPVSAFREKARAMATAVSSAPTNGTQGKFNVMKCSPMLPYIDLKMCMRLSDAEPEPTTTARPSFFSRWKKAPPPPEDLVELAVKDIEAHSKSVLVNPLTLPKFANVEMELGLLGCPGCFMNGCTPPLSCKKDPDAGDEYNYVQLFHVTRAGIPALQGVFSPRCIDIVELLAQTGLTGLLTKMAGGIITEDILKEGGDKKLLEGKYCFYMAEHKTGEEVTLEFKEKNTIVFPSDNVCIDHLLWVTVNWQKMSVPLAPIPASPLICWSRKQLAVDGFAQPVVPWLSEEYKAVIGLTDILSGVFDEREMAGKLKEAKKWCKDEGAATVQEIIDYPDLVDKFILQLTNKTIPAGKLRRAFEAAGNRG